MLKKHNNFVQLLRRHVVPAISYNLLEYVFLVRNLGAKVVAHVFTPMTDYTLTRDLAGLLNQLILYTLIKALEMQYYCISHRVTS